MSKSMHRWLVALVPVALAALYAAQEALVDGGLDGTDARVILLAAANALLVAVINIVRAFEDPSLPGGPSTP